MSIGSNTLPAQWLARGFAKRESQSKRLAELLAWQEGNPPRRNEVAHAQQAFTDYFEEEASTNFADLLVSSYGERMAVREIQTAASNDEQDKKAWEFWLTNNLDTVSTQIVETMLALGWSYTMVGEDPDAAEGASDADRLLVTYEDPRDLVTFHNPANEARIRAAVKFLHDPDMDRDVAVVMLAATLTGEATSRRWVAYKDSNVEAGGGSGIFDPDIWQWDPDAGGADGEALKHPLVPVVRFTNKNKKGEFETHLRILRRIDRLVFQLTVIIMYQAFKQRAVIVDEDASEVEIQGAFQSEVLGGLDDVLTSDPGSWFLLPRGAKVWESTQTDVQGILSAIKDDVMRLAAVSRRPMAIFAPDNQSATGADFTREGLTFGVEDRILRATQGWRDTYNLMFLTVGDEERADKSKIVIGWKPTERYSLTDMATATQSVATIMPKRSIWRIVWQMSPQEIDQVESEAADEALLATAFELDDTTPPGPTPTEPSPAPAPQPGLPPSPKPAPPPRQEASAVPPDDARA